MSRTRWIAWSAAGLLVLGACGGEGDDSAVTGAAVTDAPASHAAADTPSAEQEANDQPAVSGEPRATLRIDGTEHTLTLVDLSYASCNLTSDGGSVMGMESEDGFTLRFAGGDVWSASVEDPEQRTIWIAASHGISTDTSAERQDGRLVVSGNWIDESGSGKTANITAEVICP